MTTTRPLPTDKHGNVYYGPRTFREAKNQIDHMHTAEEISDCAYMIERAGYTGVARRIRRHFGV